MLDFEGNLVKNKDRVRIMMSDTGSSEMMEIEKAVSDIDMTIICKIYHQEHNVWYYSHGRLADLLVRYGTMSH